MDTLGLWLPIVVSAVVVFFCSSLAWTVLPHHKPDFRKLPDEDAILRTLKETDVPPGPYMFPHSDSREKQTDEEKEAFKQKWEGGCTGTLVVFGNVNMGANMFWTFVNFLVSSAFLAYLSTIALNPGDEFSHVFRFVGTAAIMTYCFAGIPNAIWFKRRIISDIADGIAYGLATGLVFGLLWPGG